MPARIPMTERQRAELLALPGTEDEVVRHYSLDDADLAMIAKARTPATRLGYALQLFCLRFPGRYLRRGEVLPALMLDYIAESGRPMVIVATKADRLKPSRKGSAIDKVVREMGVPREVIIPFSSVNNVGRGDLWLALAGATGLFGRESEKVLEVERGAS